MKKKAATLALLAMALVSTVFAAEGPVPRGIPHLDHVFVIMMENHGYKRLYSRIQDDFYVPAENFRSVWQSNW